jgi:glycosyltransferase involved in cell wall biosynthesis
LPPPQQPTAPFTATVVITTKNRKDELRSAVASALAQTAKPEVLVIDDGSTDGTSDMIRSEFPAVRLDRAEQSLGLVVQRNRGAKLASGDIIFSIDDDAVFSTPKTIAQTLAEFDHPRIGAIGIPFINVKQDDIVRQRAPDADRAYVSDQYIGTAHALRRELFLALSGYREYIIHQGEEGDYCLRMLDAGYVVRVGRGDPIHHFESPRRDFRRMDLYGRRNDVLFVWHNVPAAYVPIRWIRTAAGGMRRGFTVGRPLRMLQGLLWGAGSVVRRIGHRQPVSTPAYLLARELFKRGPLPLEEIESRLPAMRELSQLKPVRQ